MSKKRGVKTKSTTKQSLDYLFQTYASIHGAKKSQHDLDQTLLSASSRQGNLPKKISKSVLMKTNL